MIYLHSRSIPFIVGQRKLVIMVDFIFERCSLTKKRELLSTEMVLVSYMGSYALLMLLKVWFQS